MVAFMFAPYFSHQTELVEKSFLRSLKKKGSPAPGKKKDLSLYEAFYVFLKHHVPVSFSIATGKVRNNKQILKKDCDLLIYKKWCESYLTLSGGYILAENLHAFLSLESDLSESHVIATHLALTRALKSLYAHNKEELTHSIIPLYSILFAYGSQRSLLYLKQNLLSIIEKKQSPLNHQVDMICVLGKGLLLKDWESGGGYRGIETGKDTLMWFYIILMEYLDRDNSVNVNLREYIKKTRHYAEC